MLQNHSRCCQWSIKLIEINDQNILKKYYIIGAFKPQLLLGIINYVVDLN